MFNRNTIIVIAAALFTASCTQEAGQNDSGSDTGIFPGVYELDGSAAARAACEIAGNVVINVDVDRDGYGGFEGCAQPDQAWPFGIANLSGDCNDNSAAVHPNAVELCANNIDDNCAGGTDEQSCTTQVITCRADFDNDGYSTGGSLVSADADCADAGEAELTDPAGDCNDTNVDVHPNATEVCNDVDDDCDIDGHADEGIGVQKYGQDADADTYGSALVTKDDCSQPAGYVQNLLDCDDAHATAKPGGTEVPGNGIDEDCDGLGDDSVSGTCYADADNDGFRTGVVVTNNDLDCDDSGEAYSTETAGDCNDNSVTTNPNAVDSTVDSIDQDCDGVDGNDGSTVCYADADEDGYRTAVVIANNDLDCNDLGEAYVTEPGIDCDDTKTTVHPGLADTTVDGTDQDCNGMDGNGATTTCYADYDNDGVRTGINVTSVDADCDDPGEAWATELSGDCDDLLASVKPGAAEIVGDSIDENCDGVEMCYADVDNDGYRPTSTSATTSSTDADCYDANESTLSDVASDCNDSVPSIKPGATEVCNNLDDNCDGRIDDGVAMSTWYQDADADGYGNTSLPSTACTQPSGRVSTGGDCNDSNALIKPNASEIAGDNVDQNCDGGEMCYTDADNDGYRPNATSTTSSSDSDCADGNEAVISDPTTDCNDGSSSVHPGATEVVSNGIDEDCNGSDVTSAIYYYDGDADNYGTNSNWRTSPAAGYVPLGNDCNDTNSTIHPGASDPINSIDEDCNGVDGTSSSSRVTSTWTFTLDAAATAMTFDQLEVKNLSSGTTTSVYSSARSGSVVTITLTTQPTDVLSVQCWLAGNNDWCASNNHSGHLIGATGPTGAYSVGQNSGDLKYVTDGNGKRYGGSVK